MPASLSIAELSRRGFLKVARDATVAAVGASLLPLGLGLPADAAPSQGGTLRVALPFDVANFDPFILPYDNYFMQRALYDSLVQYDQNGKPVPQLAESWELTKDATSIRLRLRRGVQFHSGREVEAADVASTIRYVQDPKNASFFIFLFRRIATVETPDKYTVVLRFSRPFPAVFDALDLAFVLDLQAGTDFKTEPAGSGPFTVEDWQPGVQLTLVRNRQYWDAPRPYLDRLTLRRIPDPASLVTNLQSGDADLIWKFPLALCAPLQGSSRFKVDVGLLGINYYDLALRVTEPPFNNKLLRQALNWAIDRDQIVKNVLYGLSPTTDLPFPRYSIAYDATLDRHYRYDLDRAKALIAKAGLTNVTFTATASDQFLPGSSALAEILQGSLRKIGVQMTIQNVDSPRYNQIDNAKSYQMLVHSFGRSGFDPDVLFGGTVYWRPTDNRTGFSSAEYAATVEEASATIDVRKRKALYRRVAEIILDECFVIPIAPSPGPFAMARGVNGFYTDRSGVPVLKNLWMSK